MNTIKKIIKPGALAMALAALAAVAFAVIMAWKIINTVDAQAGIAFLFLPIWVGASFAVFLGITWSLIDILRTLCRASGKPVRLYRIILDCCMFGFASWIIIHFVMLEQYDKAVSLATTQPEKFERIYEIAKRHKKIESMQMYWLNLPKFMLYGGHGDGLMMAMAENPNCPTNVLAKLLFEESSVSSRVLMNQAWQKLNQGD